MTIAGTRQSLHLGSGRSADVFRVGGSLALSGKNRPGRALNAEFIGLSDSQSGMQGRSVWTDDRNEKVFSEMSSDAGTTPRVIVGRIVGGTGRYAGLTGEYTFTWRPLVISDDGSVAGRIDDLKGRAHFATTDKAEMPVRGQP